MSSVSNQALHYVVRRQIVIDYMMINPGAILTVAAGHEFARGYTPTRAAIPPKKCEVALPDNVQKHFGEFALGPFSDAALSTGLWMVMGTLPPQDTIRLTIVHLGTLTSRFVSQGLLASLGDNLLPAILGQVLLAYEPGSNPTVVEPLTPGEVFSPVTKLA